jgi:hypothetical protein
VVMVGLKSMQSHGAPPDGHRLSISMKRRPRQFFLPRFVSFRA